MSKNYSCGTLLKQIHDIMEKNANNVLQKFDFFNSQQQKKIYDLFNICKNPGSSWYFRMMKPLKNHISFISCVNIASISLYKLRELYSHIFRRLRKRRTSLFPISSAEQNHY